MNDLKKRIENIKYWRRWLIISAVFFSCGILQGVFPELFNSLINIFKAAGDIGLLIAFVLLGIGPYFSIFFFVLGLSGMTGREVRCSKCNTKMSLKELEAIGDEFRC